MKNDIKPSLDIDNNSLSNENNKKIKKLEKSVKRSKFFSRIRLFITLFIVVGLIVYLIAIYLAANSLSIEEKTIKTVRSTGNIDEYEAILVLKINNPTSTAIDIDRLTYDAYLDDNFVGEGEKSFFSIDSGLHEYEFIVIFEITDLPIPIKNLFLNEKADLTIKGEITIPAKVFGLFTYTTITVPYSVTDEISGAEDGADGDGIGAPRAVILNEPAPTGLTSISLSWTMSIESDFVKYEVHMSTTAGFEPTSQTLEATITDISTTTHEVRDLAHLTTYYYKIVVWDDEDLSASSNEVSYFNP